MKKTDKYGFVIYTELPDGARNVKCITEFNKNGKKNIGMKYLIWSEIYDEYQEYEITKHTKASKLQKFIDAGRVWIIIIK